MENCVKKKKKKKPPRTQTHTQKTNPIYYHPFRHFLYITYVHVRPNIFLKGFVKKKQQQKIIKKKQNHQKVFGEPGRHRGDANHDFKSTERKRLISEISCASTVTFLHTAYRPTVHESGTGSPQLELPLFPSTH